MEKQKVFIARFGEVALKGMNKPWFEKVLVERIREAARGYPGLTVRRHEGLIFVRADQEADSEGLVEAIAKVFGIASISPVQETESTLEAIGETAVGHMRGLIEKKGIRAFKVEAKRADKGFPVQSPEIARIIGGDVLAGCPGLTVDVREPECVLFVDVRKDHSYIFDEKIAGPGGLPRGTNGKGLLLLSGGIDSPVAGWMIAKRGMRVEAVHFHSYPYTSLRARQKAEELASALASWCGGFPLYMVNLLPIQEQIAERCPDEESIILTRRFMLRIAERIAGAGQCRALITGESLGQVASQTAEAIAVTDEAVGLPVLRPLIGLDKVDIIDRAKEIGTYEISVQPYEDCCTVFLPKHPVTKPKLERIMMSESRLDIEGLTAAAIAEKEVAQIPL